MIEIERKFLIDRTILTDEILQKRRSTHIAQGYISLDPVVRIRSISTTVGKQYFLCVKGRGLSSRYEFEKPVSTEDGVELFKLASVSIEKTRTKISVGKHIWEVDMFSGNLSGLAIAEIELLSEDEVFEKPDWITEEVTFDRSYTNVELAKRAINGITTIPIS